MGNFGGNPPYFFCDFSLISKVFFHIHEYEKLIICMSGNLVKELCLSIILVSCLLLKGNKKLRYQ